MCFPGAVPMRFTKPSIAALELPAGKSELIVFDDTMPGFGVRLRAGGKRTWIVQYRLGRKQRRLTLGAVGTVPLDSARRSAAEALSKVGLAIDPQADKLRSRAGASVTLGRGRRPLSRVCRGEAASAKLCRDAAPSEEGMGASARATDHRGRARHHRQSSRRTGEGKWTCRRRSGAGGSVGMLHLGDEGGSCRE